MYKCKWPECGSVVRTDQGLKSHNTRVHGGRWPSGVNSSQTLVKGSEVNVNPSQTAVKCQTEVQCKRSFSRSEVGSKQEVPKEETAKIHLVELLANLRSNLSILRRIPKGARQLAAKAMSDTIEECLRVNSAESWERLLLFPAIALQVPKNREERQISLTAEVKRNVNSFMEGKMIFKITPRTVNIKNPNQEERLSKCVVAKLSEGDVSGAVRVLCSEDTIAPRTPETVATLRKKHPPHSFQLECPVSGGEDDREAWLVKEEEVKAAVSSFPAGSAGGMDMLRPQHLKDMMGHGVGLEAVRLCQNLTRLCNVMLRGEVPEDICPVLYGASLCAFRKENSDIRPIAVGSTFRRLVAKLGSSHISAKLGEKLQPVQMGFGVRGGVEAAAHAARRYMEHQHTTQKVFMKIDFANAFNLVRRDRMLQEVMDQTPDLFKFINQCYSKPSHLAFGEVIIPSVRGIQQGDPLGPALFCMIVHPMAQDLKSEFNVWFLDDSSLGGTPEVVLQDFRTLKLRSAELGLELNYSKCELFGVGQGTVTLSEDVKAAFEGEAPSLRFPPLEKCVLLGCPLKEEAMESCMFKKIEALKVASSRLVSVPAHVAFFLLKNSLAIPRLVHVLRSSPIWKHTASLTQFDSTLRSAVQLITNITLSEQAWEQSSWPVAEGGLGIRRVSDLALAAFLASSYNTDILVNNILPDEVKIVEDCHIQAGMEVWQREMELPLPQMEHRSFQSHWEGPRVKISIKKINELAATSKNKARLIGISSKESGAFLNALPSATLGTLMGDDTFRIAVGLRLGADLCQTHTCCCGVTVDSSGTHGLACKFSKGRSVRHASVNDIIKRALNSAGIPSILEPSHLERNDNKRPDGVTQVPWKNGKSLIWDFTCSDGLAPSYVEASAMEHLFAAKTAERNKKTKYSNLCQQNIFVPVAVECLGSFGREGLKFIKEVGRRITTETGEKRAGEYLIQRISVAVQRGNALSVLGTIPQGPTLDEWFNML